jgi:hypothetical protein
MDLAPERLEIYERLLDAYIGQGLLAEPDGGEQSLPIPLCEECRYCADCWPPRTPRPDNPLAKGASLPWVGAQFASHRVVVVAMNQANAGGPLMQFDVSRGMREKVGEGRRSTGGSSFGDAVARYVASVVRSMGGQSQQPLPEPDELAAAWDACAVVEAVKCSPASPPGADRHRSTPTPGMWSRCPPFLLPKEFEILAPRAVIALGRTVAFQALFELPGVERTTPVPGSMTALRYVLSIGGRQLPMFVPYHPGYHRWRWSLRALRDNLELHPIFAEVCPEQANARSSAAPETIE